MQNDNSLKVKSRSRFSRNLFLFGNLLIILVGVWALLNRQFIIDQFTVWRFKPSSEVKALASGSGMNSQGEFYYLASRPQLDERDDFNDNCKTREASTMILGCYSSGRIYIFNTSDERINGVKTVTAAHEMLHAAYERLSADDRNHLDKLLSDYLGTITDQSMLDLVKMYDKTEPGQRNNELHSLFATEVNNLPIELENYYKKYFANRSKVVAAYKKYHEVFTNLETVSKNLEATLEKQKAQINSQTEEYKVASKNLESDIKSFNKKAAVSGGFSSQSEFDNARADLMARQKDLDNLVDAINNGVSEYNKNVEELNALGVEIDKLNQSLSSKTEKID